MAATRDEDARVRAQYEALPYPARDPADEKRRLIAGSPSHLAEINHYVFAGARDFARPFRALVAGGGTGDGAIMLAQQLAWAGAGGETGGTVVYLDVSRAARSVAEARAEARGLDNIRFVTGSLLDLAALDLGRFDYIDCCGVLHHLADPGAGLAALVAALEPGGGLGLMLYGEYGRTGVYPAQAMLRLLAAPEMEDAGARVDRARRLLDALPETNWLKRNPFVGDHFAGDDAGLYDLLLHSRDRAFTVPGIARLAAGAGLAVTGFIEPALYDPLLHVGDRDLRERLAALPWIERCAFAELLLVSPKRHVLYAVPEARAGAGVARADGPAAVPVLRDADGLARGRRLKGGGRIKAEVEGVKLAFELPPLAAAILARIDGRRSLGAIQAELAAATPRGLDWLVFKGAFDRLYGALNALNVMLIRRP